MQYCVDKIKFKIFRKPLNTFIKCNLLITNIILKAGKGGNGIVSFRREKFVPAGGPSGGNGGRGGSVILMADNNLQTLLDFKFKREIIAEDGCKGGPNKRSGASGEDTILKVPCGTEIRDIKTGIILGDLTKDKQSLTIAIGGRWTW